MPFGQVRYARLERSEQVSDTLGGRLSGGYLQIASQCLPYELGALQARAPADAGESFSQLLRDANRQLTVHNALHCIAVQRNAKSP